MKIYYTRSDFEMSSRKKKVQNIFIVSVLKFLSGISSSSFTGEVHSLGFIFLNDLTKSEKKIFLQNVIDLMQN